MKERTSWLLVIAALFLILPGAVPQSEAGVSLNVGVNLPAYRFAAPPHVVVIPGTYVYMVPDIDVDILFYQGYWWRPYEGQWYRSRDYKGSWRHVEHRRIPRGLTELPQDYRQRLSSEHDRVSHRDVQKHWKKWEKERRWERQGRHNRGQNNDPDRERREEQHKGRR